MSGKREQQIGRIKELESKHLAREDIRDFVIQTGKAVAKDNDILAEQVNKKLKKIEFDQ